MSAVAGGGTSLRASTLTESLSWNKLHAQRLISSQHVLLPVTQVSVQLRLAATLQGIPDCLVRIDKIALVSRTAEAHIAGVSGAPIKGCQCSSLVMPVADASYQYGNMLVDTWLFTLEQNGCIMHVLSHVAAGGASDGGCEEGWVEAEPSQVHLHS
jgi:hypothetical protein